MNKKNIKVHFIGIGGIGMSGLAGILVSLGYKVSGSDLNRSANTQKLEKLGVKVYFSHEEENLNDSTLVVYSSAIKPTNPEMKAAKEKDIPIMRRAEMLAEIMRLKKSIAVAGTHGKTTTTSFLATILEESRFEPTYIIGGIVRNLDGHAKVGKGEFLVAEADESDGTFLLLSPQMSIITNIDNDHLDHYGTEENLLNSFSKFSNRIPFYGVVALNFSDPKVKELKNKMKKPWVSFGFEEDVDYRAANIENETNGCSFDLFFQGDKVQRMTISLPGEHNILNALGAIAISHQMQVSFETIREGIAKFEGVGRRFQLLKKTDDIEFYDDYAHHPTEVLATLKALKEMREDRKRIAFFEPHRYTRTRDCWKEFLNCFNYVDQVYISPIYAASEDEIGGITSEQLCKDINKLHPDLSRHIKSLNEIGDILEKEKNCVAISLGAGAIGKKIREILNV